MVKILHKQVYKHNMNYKKNYNKLVQKIKYRNFKKSQYKKIF